MTATATAATLPDTKYLRNKRLIHVRRLKIMNKRLVITILLLLLIGFVIYKPKKIESKSFSATGILERNTPGTPKSDTWFLHYELDPATGQGRFVELVSQDYSAYNYLGFAKVIGTITNNVVTVSEISALAQGERPYADETQVLYHKSDVYGYFGTMTLKGYLEIEKHVCGPNDGECSQTVDYANFVFARKDNPQALDDLFHFGNGPFLSAGKIGLGCYEKSKSQISYQNNSDKDVIQGSIKSSDLSALLSSSSSKLVEMKMTQMVILNGKGAPDCYSTFRNFDVL